MRFSLSLLAQAALSLAQLSSTNLEKHVDTLTLGSSVNPVREAYWTGYPHHTRTPFGLSPNGKVAYLAYLDASGSGVHVQGVNPETFAATGSPVTIAGAKEAGGLVVHDDGFAVLVNEPMPSGTTNAPAGETPVAVIYRYTGGTQTWKTWLGGPDVEGGFSGLVSSPDINGDLVFNAKAGYYAAYLVVTSYTGDFAGHFGDAIRYVTTAGKLENIAGASSDWGCSHNTGIAFEDADAPPYASLCAEDQGAIWLNSKTQGMNNDGVKVSNENVINGGSNEPMGGTGGSYSSLARFVGEDSYIFAWVSRGAKNLTPNDWMGNGYTKSENRTVNRNVAIALFSDKFTLVGEQATSEVGAVDGDKQINWVTQGTADTSNAHAAAFDGKQALITWEEIANPTCDFQAMGCRGEFTGTFYQLVDSTGKKVGEPVKSLDSFVAGDIVTVSPGRVCWPYVNMEWRLDAVARSLPASNTNKISFACINLGGAGSGETTAPAEPAPEAPPAATGTTTSPTAADAPAQETQDALPVGGAPAEESVPENETGAPTDDVVVPPTAPAAPAPAPSSPSAPVAEPSSVAPESSSAAIESSSAVAPVPEPTDVLKPTSASTAAPKPSFPTRSCRRKTVTKTVRVTAPGAAASDAYYY